MPELPEVEFAARTARELLEGRTIVALHVLHPALRRALDDGEAASLAGDVVIALARRGKHQMLQLASGRTLEVHFRMSGDWRAIGGEGELPPHARAVFALDDGRRLVLDDPRALATLTLHAAGSDPLSSLGPDATDAAFTPAGLAVQLAKRRGAIKPALLDQRVVAGVGNIYACEALWYARVHPATPCPRLDARALRAIVAGIRRALRRALARPGRVYGAEATPADRRLNVYGREGRPCRRCGTAITREVLAGRGTYFCPACQRRARRAPTPARRARHP
ncbi:MAG TPA: bifunctional DNA-formamidopyrimidine glycosylase/DNA-(apurinic or apyrimidinic site) lyase [Gemmatimonadales bacterium]|nr:bifunctional DNA-formamidopyrimidine glycosylase/DNA-(apurinic or apyrimidinic site) lyase [Gemmatimonadales bacterium]